MSATLERIDELTRYIGALRRSAPGRCCRHCGRVLNRAEEGPQQKATDRMLDGLVEHLTGVEARWLGGVKPFFAELLAKAQDKDLSDEDFLKALEKAQKHLPELFSKMDTTALATAMESYMGTAAVNGAVRGYLERGSGEKLKAKG